MEKFEGGLQPGPLALFTLKLPQRFPVCRRYALWKGFFDVGARLGETSVFPTFPLQIPELSALTG